MPEPLPVEVVSDWWDYLVDGVGVLSGLATAAALGVAVWVYHKQAEDLKSEQARKMVIDSNFELSPAEQDGQYLLTGLWIRVENLSEYPIFDVKMSLTLTMHGTPPELCHEPQRRIEPGGNKKYVWKLSKPFGDEMAYIPRVTFRDSAGYHWDCDPDGRLRKLSRRHANRPHTASESMRLTPIPIKPDTNRSS